MRVDLSQYSSRSLAIQYHDEVLAVVVFLQSFQGFSAHHETEQPRLPYYSPATISDGVTLL
jgi:hypothetical protein